MAEVDFDVAVIGGGPAGSAAASYLAKAGLKCVVLEREIFPRHHVGESLVPASNRVMREIGFIEKMDGAGFPRKYGAAWTAQVSEKAGYNVDWHGLEGLEDDCHATVRFEERQQEGNDRIYTWHVDRAKFDQMLLQHAHSLGATVYEGVKVQEVDLSDSTMPKIKFTMGNQQMAVKVRVVVDASGRQTLLGNQLKLKTTDPVFNQFALHTWFDGYDRKPMAPMGHRDGELDNYIFIHFLPLTNTWVWQIPISDSVTSIGVVTQKKNFEKSKESREKFFWDCVATRPELHKSLKAANQLRPLKEEGDYSYSMKQICGDGFVMVGDAARFVDPIFSSGVSIALTSAKLACLDIIKTAQNGGVFDKSSFETYQNTMRRGTKNWYDFITVYYRLNVLFTAFVQDPKYRIDVLKLLQGDLYDTDNPPVLDEMRRIVSDVEKRPNHPWHKLLGDLTNDAFNPSF